MSPLVLLRRDNCDFYGNNCNQGVRPTTYAVAIAIASVVFILASCFFMRRRRQHRHLTYRAQPIIHNPASQSYPLSSQYAQPPPPPIYFEPAPPYDVHKAPSPTPSPHPAQPDAPLLQAPSGPSPNSAPLQYPPPSYAPA